MFTIKFPERLKELREEQGLSQYELAKKLNCDITHTAISLWESNKRSPRLDAIITIARYFNVSIDYLVGLEN